MENHKVKLRTISAAEPMKQTRFIFIGTPEFGKIILEKLIKSGFPPVLVITASDKPVGRKKIITPPPVKILAEKYIIPFFQPEKIQDTSKETLGIPTGQAKYLKGDAWHPYGAGKIQDTNPDLIIVAAYGQIIPKKILDIPKYGCLNVHPSLLPKYRGPSPIQSAILNGDEETGVTIILMNEKLDSGPIVSHTRYKIQDTRYTYEALHNKLADLGGNLLVETIPKWVSGEIKAVAQDDSRATYSKILRKEDGKIDWKKPVEYIERQVRALNPWPGTYDIYNGKILKIMEVDSKDGKLIIKKVQPEGKKAMIFEDFLRGHKDYKIPC